ncbi:hypothetical protein D3C78_435890 [compost metagenome]
MAAGRDLQQRQARTVTGGLQEEIPHLALLVAMGAVIEFDGAQEGEIRRVAEQIVKALGADHVERLLPLALAQARLGGQHIRHPDLGKDPGLVADRQVQHPEEGALSRAEQGLLQLIGLGLAPLAPAPEDHQQEQHQQHGSRYDKAIHKHIPRSQDISSSSNTKGQHSTTGEPRQAELKSPPLRHSRFFTKFAWGGLHMACRSRHNARAYGRFGAQSRSQTSTDPRQSHSRRAGCKSNWSSP